MSDLKQQAYVMSECGCELDREALSSERVYWVDYRSYSLNFVRIAGIFFSRSIPFPPCQLERAKWISRAYSIPDTFHILTGRTEISPEHSYVEADLLYTNLFSPGMFRSYPSQSAMAQQLTFFYRSDSEVSSVGLVWEARDTANNNMRVAIKTPKNPATPTDWPGNW